VPALLTKIKELYWFAEAIFFEAYIKLKPVNTATNSHNLEPNLIVSLTSFPPRFKKLELTIKGLLMQSIKPDLLILWIAEDDYFLLTPELHALQNNFMWFKIRKCKDIRSYKKLIPTLIEYPNHYIVTADDDVYYPPNWLSGLVAKVTNTKEIIAHRVHHPKFSYNKILPYRNWHHNYKGNGKTLFATGIGGILYPPNCFQNAVLDEDVFMKICASADDIWFFWMARMKGVKVTWSGFDFNTVNWRGTDESGLAVENVENGKNDQCIKKMIDKYGDVW